MSKFLIVHLIDGRTLELEVDTIVKALHKAKQVDVSSPIDHPAFAQICISVAMQGIADPQGRTLRSYHHIPPSQIKLVTLDFDYNPDDNPLRTSNDEKQ